MVELSPLVQACIYAFCILIGWIVCVGGVGSLPTGSGSSTDGQFCVFASSSEGYVLAQECLGLEAVVLVTIIISEPFFFYGVWKQKYGIKRIIPLFAMIISAMLIVTANDLFYWTQQARTISATGLQTSSAKTKMVNGVNAYLASVVFLVLTMFVRACLFTIDLATWNPPTSSNVSKADTSPYQGASAPIPGGPRPISTVSFPSSTGPAQPAQYSSSMYSTPAAPANNTAV